MSEDAGAEILVTRPARDAADIAVEHILVRSLMEGRDPQANLALVGGEEVRVPQAGHVFVVGNVKHPGKFRIEGGGEITVLKLVALAEGLAPFAGKQAYIFRAPGAAASPGPRTEVPVELRKIMDRQSPDLALAADDIFYIPDNRARRATLSAIEKAVGFAAGTASGVLILGLH